MSILPHVCAAVLVCAVLPPAAAAQSDICQSLDGTEETCRDGFTCAYTFTGADVHERFTFRIVQSGNPSGTTSLIISFNGDFRTVREGSTAAGEALGWTKRSSGEGESFYRVDNRNSSGDVVSSFSCAQASTETTDPTEPGDDTISVSDMSPFAVGDSVLVAPGTPAEEGRVVTGFGSLVLDAPLQFAHAAGTTVVSIGPGPASTATDAGSSGQPLGLDIEPNPAHATPTVALTLRVPEAVSVRVYDALGREMARLHEGPLSAGRHTLALDRAPLPAGTYLVRATTETASVTRRLTLAR